MLHRFEWQFLPVTVEVGHGEGVSEVLPELFSADVGDELYVLGVEHDASLQHVIPGHAHRVIYTEKQETNCQKPRVNSAPVHSKGH